MLEMDCQLTIAVLVVIAHESAWHGADLQIHTATAIYPGSQRPDDPGSFIEFRLQASANYLTGMEGIKVADAMMEAADGVRAPAGSSS